MKMITSSNMSKGASEDLIRYIVSRLSGSRIVRVRSSSHSAIDPRNIIHSSGDQLPLVPWRRMNPISKISSEKQPKKSASPESIQFLDQKLRRHQDICTSRSGSRSSSIRKYENSHPPEMKSNRSDGSLQKHSKKNLPNLQTILSLHFP